MRKFYLFLFTSLFLFGSVAVVSAQYCTINFSNGVEPITNVSFNSISNATSNTVGGTPAYQDFSALSTEVFKTETYKLSVKGNTDGGWTNYIDVYIDWNDDKDFGGADEHYFLGTITGSTGLDAAEVSANILIPSTAVTGSVRMRVVKRYSASGTACNTTGYGQAEDYTLNISVLAPCFSTPAGGTTVAPAAACPTETFLLSTSGATFGTGLTYQWQSSPDGSTWTNIPGATGKEYLVTGQTATTHYRREITCSAGPASAFSTEVVVTLKSVVDCYCASASTNTTFESIGNVIITGGVSNSSANNTYTDYSATAIATVYQGQSVKVTIEQGTIGWASTDIAYIYGDFNQDGDFDDAGELVGSQTGATSPYVITFTVPAGATLGNTKLRIRFGDTFWGSAPITDDPCQTFTYGEVEDYGLLITPPPPCAPPSGLVVTPSSPTEELISWTASPSNPSNGYNWEIRSYGDGGSGTDGLEASGTTAAGVTNAIATGLFGGTNYFLWVQSNCGGGITSTWEGPQQFITVCDPVNVPFVQNFDATVEPDMPSCVVVQDLNGGGSWKPFFGGGNASSSEPVSMRYEWNATTPADDWFFIQGLNLVAGKTYTLSFKYKASDGPDYVENLEVKYGSSPNAAAMTAGTLFTETGISTGIASPFTTASVTFTPTTSGTYYIGFHAFSDADQAFLYIDDITVESCATPIGVTANSATPNTAEVHYTPTGGTYVIEYGPVGFAPGSDANAGDGTVITGVTAFPVTITGLDPDTQYDIYVRQSCDGGAEFSLNAMTTVRTLCEATTIPYVMNFESGTVPDVFPGCTSVFDVNGSSGPEANGTGGQWTIASGTSPDVYVSPTKTLRYIYDATNTARGADDWFFVQGLQLTGGTKYRLKFYYKASDGPTWTEKLEVKYGTSAAPAAMTELIWENNDINSAVASPWDSARVDFTPAATGVYYLGFHAKSDPDQAFLYLDDISVRLAPVVDAGIAGIKETTPNCPAPNFVMTAQVVNYNLTPLNLATYPLTVTADITGSATTTLTTTVNTGTIAPGDTLLVPFTAFNFSAGQYNIVFKASNPNDSENGNDIYQTTVFVNPTPVAAVFTPANPQACAQITTQFTTPPAAPVDLAAVSSGAITVPIPDNNAAGATHSLSVTGIPAGASVTGIRVTVNVAHTYMGDVLINLKAPNGKVINLFNRKGASGDNLVNTVFSSASTVAIPATGAPYTGTYKPDGANNVGPNGFVSNTSVATDLNGNGNWTLALMDADALISGSLTSWSIVVSYAFPHPTVTWSPATGLFTDAAGTIPYVAGTNAYAVYANPAGETVYTVTSSAAGCSNSSTVTVKPLLAVANSWPAKICTSDESIPLNALPAGGTWSGIGVSGNTLIPAVMAVGTYPLTYRYTNPAGCSVSTTVTAKVEDCPERIRLLRDDAVILFPNPSRGNFNIRINSVLYNNLTMRVYTTSGLLVQNRKLTNLAFGRVIPIDLTVLPPGSYMVQFTYEGGPRTSDKTFPVIIAR